MIRIFVEGKDTEFIKVYVDHIYGRDCKDEILVIATNGYTNLYSEPTILMELEKSELEGDFNLVVFDADSPSNGGGFEKKLAFLKDELEKIGRKAEFFLFPNNKDDGDFECMLENIINPNHKGLLTCFKGYESCVAGHNNPLYKTPNKKNMIHTYVYTFVKSKKDEKSFGKTYFYDNPEYWDLESEYLKPLKAFLTQNLNKYILEK